MSNTTSASRSLTRLLPLRNSCKNFFFQKKKKQMEEIIINNKNHKLPFLLPIPSSMLNPMTSNSSPLSEDPCPKSKLPSSSIIAPGEFWHGYGKGQELGSQNIDVGYNLEEGLIWQLAQRGTYGECWLFAALIGMIPDGYCFDWS